LRSNWKKPTLTLCFWGRRDVKSQSCPAHPAPSGSLPCATSTAANRQEKHVCLLFDFAHWLSIKKLWRKVWDMNSSRDALTFARTSDINIKHPLKFNIEILEPCLRGRGSRSTSTDACTLFTPNRHFVWLPSKSPPKAFPTRVLSSKTKKDQKKYEDSIR